MKLYLFILILITSPKLMANFSLWSTEQMVALKFSVAHLSSEQLLQRKKRSDYLLFDTRQFAEYQVSHIASAIPIDPKISPKDFIRRYAKAIKGKHLVFYCSVGYRSSKLIEQLQAQAKQAGALSLSNLTGGIFRWYNQGYPVVNQQGETNDIHPFDEKWGKLLELRQTSP